MARLEIHLLGPTEVTLDGDLVESWGTDAAQAPLAYLTLTA
jgi:hypothetical protein